jgi:D-sedoheptulose 7-phosphate isomerase
MGKNTENNHIKRYIKGLTEHIQSIDSSELESVAKTLHTAWQNHRNIFCIGNGGSAATSAHFATDLSWGRNKINQDRPKAVSLTTNTSILTALANDIGYDSVFAEQLRTFLQEHDILFAISASGNSPNIIKAIEYANSAGAITIGLVGFDGGKMKSICQECIHINTEHGAYELVEDIHHAICHMLSTYIKQL